MFTYCTVVLHLSGAEAYLRIAAARAARQHPVILDMLGDGRLHLSGIGKLVPHLTRENAPVLLARAVHRSKRQIEELVAEIAPRPDAPRLSESCREADPGPPLSQRSLERDLAHRPVPATASGRSWLNRYFSSAVDRAPGPCALQGPVHVDTQGRRCSERHQLEYHHRYPYGFGFEHSLRTVRLMCRGHNQHEAERDYGRAAMSRHRSSRIASRGSA
jgi:hypothetical protein